jgi:hypothetical protein
MDQPIPYWVSQAFRILRELVKTRTPIRIKKRPLNRETTHI